MKSQQDFLILSLLLIMITLFLFPRYLDGATDSEYVHIIYYVRPTNETSQYPGVPCLNLMEHVQNEPLHQHYRQVLVW